MARHWFGQTPADWTTSVGSGNTAVFEPGVELTVWNTRTGGTQYTDLLDAGGSPVDTVVSGDGSTYPAGTIPQFQGPDGVTNLWADAGGGTRYLMVATDLADTVANLGFDTDYLADVKDLFTTQGATGQVLGKDPDPASVLGIRWTAPPEGGSSGGGSMWVDASAGVYAADKTGVADARSAIQAAIDDVSASGGGIVYLPRGTYKIGYTANAGGTGAAGGLQLKTNVWLRGEGFATRLEATGTWSTQAGLVGIGDRATSRPVRDTRLSDMWLKGTTGTSFAGAPASNVHGVLFNTNAISGEPDAAHRLHDLWIWDTEVGVALLGTDDQAIFAQRIRGRHFLRQGLLVGKEDGSGGAADDYFFGIDMSGANMVAAGTYAGIEVYTSNNHFAQCKSWYCDRATAFVAGATYKDGAGWYVNGTRNTFVSCEAQDNGGHGWLLRLGKNTLASCIADSNNYFDNLSGSAAANECSGFYIASTISELVVSASLAFDRNSTNRYQKYGFAVDAASRNVAVTGTAWDNRSTGSSADPLDGLVWINGAAHSTHEVRVQSAYGSSRATISNSSTTGGAGSVTKRQDSGGGSTTFTGTTLQDVPALVGSVPGGSRWYEVDAWIMYRADATNNARIGMKTARDGASGSVDLNWKANYTKPDLTAGDEYSLSIIGTVRYVVADGDGNVSGVGYTNQRVAHITGRMFVSSAVTTATVTVQVAENGGTGTGVRVIENSTLSIKPLTFT